MQQVKIFRAIESDIPTLESDINAWLKESNARVVQMSGNIAPQTVSHPQRENRIGEGHTPSDVLVVIVYEPAE